MEKEYQTFEYKTLTVRKGCKYRLLDAVGAFGYQVIETKELPTTVTINIKREEITNNKEELDKGFDLVVKKITEIEALERKKKNKALAFGIILGIVGLLTFGGGLSWVTKGSDTLFNRIGGISVGVIGILIMLINEPIYRVVYQKTLSSCVSKIDELNVDINKALKSGNELIKKSLE
ncbi:MAG: hypothetical protein K6E20_01915 [Acholeplasmatales bacterium]|nr:hypothetical protein [Acholeplasmatales bacterium]